MASGSERLYTAADRADTLVRSSAWTRPGERSSHNKHHLTTDNESDKARAMSGFKEPSFADRQKAAQEARQNILNKFRAKPGPDDPAVMQRQAQPETRAAERPKAKLAREAAKAEQKRLEAEAAEQAAAQLAREKE